MPYEFFERDSLTLRVTGPTSWEVVHGFRYIDQYDNMEPHTVPSGFGPTDLTSVPFFLQWLVRSYGKHTNAALVHDVYWDDRASQATLRKANTVFRHAMWESDVPWVRRWFMWSAVTLAMLAKTWFGRMQVLLWTIALVIAFAALLGSWGVVLPWLPVKWASLGVLFVLLLMGLVIAVRNLGTNNKTGAEVHDPLLSDNDRRPQGKDPVVAIMKKVAMVLLALIAVLWLFFGTGHSDAGTERGGWVAVAALAVALGAWGSLLAAGVFATIELVIIALPVVAIAIGLLMYGVLEGLMVLLLKIGRSLKRASGRQPVGTLNPLASQHLEAPPPARTVTLKASNL